MTNTPLSDLWLMFRREHNNCSTDRMLCNTALRDKFLVAARSVCKGESDEEILWSLVNLRKRKRLPKSSQV